MNSIISYTKNIAFAKRFFGFSFAILGVTMLLLTGSLFALIFIIIGLGLNVAEGSEINLSAKTFRTFNSLFGFKTGK